MGKRGPRKISTSVLRLRGSWRADGRKDLKIDDDMPEMPDFLNEDGRKVWKHVVKKLAPLNILCSADSTMLMLLCSAYEDWKEADELCKSVLIKTETGRIKVNPAIVLRSEAWSRLRRACLEFYMTPASRTGLPALQKPKDKDNKDRFFVKRTLRDDSA